MKITEQTYLKWQTRLQAHGVYRKWWQFWSNYSFLFFIIVGFQIWGQTGAEQVLTVSFLAFIVSRFLVWMIIGLAGYRLPRPYQKFSFAPITSLFFSFKTKSHNSFPSRHVTAFAAIAAVVLSYFPLLGAGLFAVCILTGIGRVVLGYHYPSDIIAGLILGGVVGLILAFFLPSILFT